MPLLHTVEIRTGSRLHFGLTELNESEPFCYGGCGLMLDTPGFSFRLSEDSSDGNSEPRIAVDKALNGDAYVSRIRQVLDIRRELYQNTRLPAKIDLLSAMPLHAGLGAGTQIACAVATGIALYDQFSSTDGDAVAAQVPSSNSAQCYGVADLCSGRFDESWLVKHAGRGLRSAIGLHGYLYGGFVVDDGYQISGSSLRSVSTRSTNLPSPWRVLLARPLNSYAVFGETESQLLKDLASNPNPNRKRMQELASDMRRILLTEPASRTDQFNQFTSCLAEYMCMAGEMFRPIQGGLYNGERANETVQAMKAIGLQGVGQSSWGPTVFGFAADQIQANNAHQRLVSQLGSKEFDIRTAIPASTGASFRLVTNW